MTDIASVAIETSCRRGGVALGIGERLVATAEFDASARHATQLVGRLDELLTAAGLRPADLSEVYVSVGPGSFTGTRVGVTVARTLAQAVGSLRCVAVPSPAAVAEAARTLPWQRLGVVLDAREGLVHATFFARRGRRIVQVGRAGVMSPAELLARAERPIVLLGEGLGYHDLRGDGITIPAAESPDAPPHVPTAAGVWRLGRRLAAAGGYTDFHRLLPVYCRKPAAVRAWEQRRRGSGEGSR